MFASEETVEVTMLCDNTVMKLVIDKFGRAVDTEPVGDDHFRIRVRVCTGPTFYSWVFGAGGKIRIEGPEMTVEAYKKMVKDIYESL